MKVRSGTQPMNPPLPVIGAVAVISVTLFAAGLAKVLSPAKGTQVPKAQAAETMTEGTTVVPKTIRTIDIYPKLASAESVVPIAPAEPVSPRPTVATANEAKMAAPEPPAAERLSHRHATNDGGVCARHHLRMVIVGRGWRCRHAS